MISKRLRAWSQARLAEASGLALSTIKRMEASDGLLRSTAENVWKVERALENAGVAFIDESNELGPGVRLTRQEKRIRANSVSGPRGS